MKRILALDIATVTGAASDKPRGAFSAIDRPYTFHFRTPVDAFGDYGRAFGTFERWLMDTIIAHEPDVVAFEAPLIVGGRHGTTAPTNVATVRLLLGLCSIAELVAHRAQLECFETHIQSVRKHFTGSGRAQKRDVLERCRVLGWHVGTNDEADAAAIWDYARHTLRAGPVIAGPLMAARST